MEQLSATAYVILGFVRNEPRSGYEIKALVDNSTRFFWAASYGQIYPELKRLSEVGLIVGSDTPTGGRKRTVYEITADGEEELRSWLRQRPETFEMRDEGLLKLIGEVEDPFPLIVLEGGLEFTQWFAEWCERIEARILDSAPDERSR